MATWLGTHAKITVLPKSVSDIFLVSLVCMGGFGFLFGLLLGWIESLRISKIYPSEFLIMSSAILIACNSTE